ncbi:MAG: DMT family transporter [Burkholderiaceae bacterium]|jgi:drug/metabolite transporter (DMT)-like permease|nr:DMT family transporter [Burkholderiaceae bacterium]
MSVFEKRWAVIGLLINALVWGVSWWPLRELHAAGFHPLWSTLLVFTPALVFAGLWYRSAWRGVLSCGGLWALALAAGATNVGFNWAVTTGDVIRVVLLFYTMPAWAVPLAWWLLGERPTTGALMRLVLAFVGVWLVLWEPGAGWPVPKDFADVLALCAGFLFALNNVLLRRTHARSSGERVLAMFFGGVLLNAVVACTGVGLGLLAWPEPDSVASPHWMWIAAGLSGALIAGNLALQFGASRLRSATTSIIMLSELLFASISSIALGAAVFQTRIGWGAAFIVTAAVLASLERAPKSAQA